MKRRLAATALILMLPLGMAACGSQSKADACKEINNARDKALEQVDALSAFSGSEDFKNKLDVFLAIHKEAAKKVTNDDVKAAYADVITDMDKPLGHNIGNALEVAESMAVLQGKGPADLTEVCLQLAGNMLVLAGKGDMPTCRKLAESVIADGSAFEKCCQMFAAQGGDISVLRDADKFQKAKYSYELTAPADGYIYKNDVEKIGNASVLLGAGRIKKEDSIDFAAGITMHKKLGDYVKAGESICTFYADDESCLPQPRKCTAAALSSAMSRRRFRPSSTRA